MDTEPAYIYVIGAAGIGAVKIGWTADVTVRLAGLQTGCPFPLIVMWKRQLASAPLVEAALHRRFGGKRVRGEWFDLGPDAVRIVREAAEEITSDLPPGLVAAELILSPRERVRRDVATLIEIRFAGQRFIGGVALCDELLRLPEPLYDRSKAGMAALLMEAICFPAREVPIDGRKIRGWYAEDLREITARTPGGRYPGLARTETSREAGQ